MSNAAAVISQLNAATTTTVLVLSFINFVPGSIGLILNVVVFTQPTLRREPCVRYLLSSSIADLFVEFVVLPVRIVSNGFNKDLAFYNVGICKVETYSFYTVRALASWLIAFACVDRFFHSSTNGHLRRLSSLKIARLAIGITTVSMIIIYIHMPFYYEITYSRDQNGTLIPTCNGQKGTYFTFITFWHMAFYALLPAFVMLLFGCLTLNNIRRRSKVLPTATQGRRIVKRTEIQLLRMLSAQVFVIICATLPHSIYRIYIAFTANEPRNGLRSAQENLASQTVNTLTYFAHTSHFYLYTLTGSNFRKEVLKIFHRILHPYRNLSSV